MTLNRISACGTIDILRYRFCPRAKRELKINGTMTKRRARLPTMVHSRTLSQAGDDVVEGRTWVHGCICLCLVNPVVATEINRRSLTFDQLIQDGRFLLTQRSSCLGKCGFEGLVIVLLGQLFGPVSRNPVMAASVVDLLLLPRRILVRSQESPNGLIEGCSHCFGLRIVRSEILESARQSQILTQ